VKRHEVAKHFYKADWCIRWTHYWVHNHVRKIYTPNLPAYKCPADGLEGMNEPEVRENLRLYLARCTRQEHDRPQKLSYEDAGYVYHWVEQTRSMAVSWPCVTGHQRTLARAPPAS